MLAEIPLFPDVVSAGDKGRPAALDPETPSGAAFRALARVVDARLAELAAGAS